MESVLLKTPVLSAVRMAAEGSAVLVAPGPPLLVGEANPYSDDAYYALYPWPRRSAGYRLAYRILELHHRDAYLQGFERMNLCAGRRWSVRFAREGWHGRLTRPLPPRIVLLGSKVCGIVGAPFEPFSVWSVGPVLAFVVLPHPSGRCRLWNEPTALVRAQGALASSGVL